MTHTERFVAYAAAFERTFDSDDFSHLKASVDGFASRELQLIEGPVESGDSVWFRWAARYTRPGLPDLEISGEETVTFLGDRIVRMEDVIAPEAVADMMAYIAEHAEALGTPP